MNLKERGSRVPIAGRLPMPCLTEEEAGYSVFVYIMGMFQIKVRVKEVTESVWIHFIQLNKYSLKG